MDSSNQPGAQQSLGRTAAQFNSWLDRIAALCKRMQEVPTMVEVKPGEFSIPLHCVELRIVPVGVYFVVLAKGMRSSQGVADVKHGTLITGFQYSGEGNRYRVLLSDGAVDITLTTEEAATDGAVGTPS